MSTCVEGILATFVLLRRLCTQRVKDLDLGDIQEVLDCYRWVVCTPLIQTIVGLKA